MTDKIRALLSKIPIPLRWSSLGLLSIFLCFHVYQFFQIAEFHWKENDKKMYQIEIKSFQNMNSEQLAMIDSSLEVSTKGILNMRVMEVESSKIKIAFQFSSLEMKAGGVRQIALETIASHPFLGEWTKDGKIIRWILPYNIALKDEMLVLQNLLLFLTEISGDRKKWITKESDSFGEFIAKYNYKSGKILKSKVKYQKVSVEDLGDLETEKFTSNIQVSYAEFVLDEKNSWIQSGKLKERFELTGNLFEVDASREASIQEIPFQPDPEVAIWKDPLKFEDLYNRFTKEPKKKLSIWEESKRMELEKEFRNRDFISIVRQFLPDPNRFSDLPSLEKLRDYLNVFPEEALKVPGLIQSQKIRGHQIMEVLYILAKLGHKEAQVALVSISRDTNQDYHARMQSISNFHEVKYPIDSIAPTLWEVYKSRNTDKEKDLSNTAILALGSISSRTQQLSANGISESDEIKNKLLKELEISSKDKDKTSVLLSAIGNTNDSSLLPKIKDNIQSEDKMVRAAFFDAISNFPSKEAKDILKDRLSKEESFEARNKIIKGLLQKEGDPETLKQVFDSLLQENDANNRSYMIQYLIQNKGHSSDYQNSLKQILEKEGNSTNRELIYKGLYSP